ncbi:MAG: prepilin-type N-terminal cleavage/methylation domain-containing protein, partial [Candidatus Aureabacteria bacterium]|nr:prepilin-type N-terminal cleavage/methylation domain-containing protein [Candidatus Auribacterota bacterium]
MKNIFKRKKKPEGFTLVEVVASLLILSIGVLGIMSLFPVGIRAVTNANDTA